IPARQLPDKAVSLLDTACARVAISQSTTPALIADLRASIEAKRRELDAQSREGELGLEDEERIGELTVEIAETEKRLAEIEDEFRKERSLVDEIVAYRGVMGKAEATGGAEEAAAGASPAPEDNPKEALKSRLKQLDEIDAAQRMIYAHVDEAAVASVVSDWT